MPVSLPCIRCLSVMDDGYRPVPVVPNVEDHVAIHKIGILEHAANFIKMVPADRLDNGGPSLDLVRRIRVAFHRLPQMLARNDMPSFSVCEVVNNNLSDVLILQNQQFMGFLLSLAYGPLADWAELPGAAFDPPPRSADSV